MKKIILKLFLFSFLIACSDSGLNSSDKIYETIVGKWSSAGTKTTFYSDKTYVDSSFLVSNSNHLLFVINGKYIIERDILKKSNYSFSFLDTILFDQYFNLTSFPFDLEIISTTNSEINFKEVEEFESINGRPSDDLWADWKSTKWIMNIENGIAHTGRLNYYYSFYKDSSHINYGIEYLDDLPLESYFDKRTFSYNPPFLTTNGIQKIVKFKKGYMYWYYEDVLYTRIQ